MMQCFNRFDPLVVMVMCSSDLIRFRTLYVHTRKFISAPDFFAPPLAPAGAWVALFQRPATPAPQHPCQPCSSPVLVWRRRPPRAAPPCTSCCNADRLVRRRLPPRAAPRRTSSLVLVWRRHPPRAAPPCTSCGNADRLVRRHLPPRARRGVPRHRSSCGAAVHRVRRHRVPRQSPCVAPPSSSGSAAVSFSCCRGVPRAILRRQCRGRWPASALDCVGEDPGGPRATDRHCCAAAPPGLPPAWMPGLRLLLRLSSTQALRRETERVEAVYAVHP
jgi:hypothetical protein